MELKAMTVLNVQQMGCYDNALVYFKSEADKLIAEKDAEIAQLQAMLEERNKYVGELEEERRWRKCSEEMPKSDIEQYLVYDTKTKEYGKSFCSHSLKNFQFPVTHWMPLPKAPEGK